MFTEKGEFIKAFKTIDELGVPKFKLKNVGNGIKMHTLEPDFYGNYSRAINNDFIFSAHSKKISSKCLHIKNKTISTNGTE